MLQNQSILPCYYGDTTISQYVKVQIHRFIYSRLICSHKYIYVAKRHMFVSTMPPSFWPVVTQLNTFKCNIIQLLIQDKYLNVTDITLQLSVKAKRLVCGSGPKTDSMDTRVMNLTSFTEEGWENHRVQAECHPDCDIRSGVSNSRPHGPVSCRFQMCA